ncbi:MAG: czcO 2 [Phycisphaerales bacterium]|nr:czcO 2 [Phycisphaerales bacterium]
MPQHHTVLIVGGGQAGLSMSYCLKQRGIDHLVLEKDRVGHAWRAQRWDTFCLVTPNWQCKLPGFDYAADFGGDDPNGFMKKDDIVRYIEEYVASFGPPVREGVEAVHLGRTPGGPAAFELKTTAGDFTADHVVVAVGGYHTPNVPRMAERLPASVRQFHSAQYLNPAQFPAGDVLVVGTGQSGCQIAEDLHLAFAAEAAAGGTPARRVHLCVGGAPRVARRYRGKDVVDWLDLMGFYDLPVQDHPLKQGVRTRANHYVTGRDGGRDIDLRKFAAEGMQLHGRLTDVRDGLLHFGDDLKRNLDKADETSENIKTSIDKYIDKHGLTAPTEPRYTPVWEPPADPAGSLDLAAAGIGSVIWSIGYRSDYRWIDLPAFDGKGYPAHARGVTPVDGLYFLGLPWLYTWGSGRFCGVARDAEYLAERIALVGVPSAPADDDGDTAPERAAERFLAGAVA